jgi:iron complex outermembrane receptor protein/vitamin B12 transporter
MHSVAYPLAFKRSSIAKTSFIVHIALAIALFLIAGRSPLAAQQVKTIHGEVHDPLGDLVASATVDLLEDTRVVATTTTNAVGRFQFTLPEPGRYQVRVVAPSFQTTTTTAAYFGGSAKTELSVTLATATLTQQVTVTATGTPTPEAQTGASITVLPAEDFRLMAEVQEPLRLVPGVQITQTGMTGGTAGLSIRGGETTANKVLIDGVPANTIGGGVEFANLATAGIESIEVLREPNSALYGSDALAGVVSLTTKRGTTPRPLFTYDGDAGNFGTYHDEVTAGTVYRQFDVYSDFARIDTRNSLPNSEFHNATYAGSFGWTPDAANDVRFTVRHIAVSGGQPNAIALYGIPDDAQQKEQDTYYGAVWNNQTTPKWHNQIRYGGLRQNGSFNSFGATGIPDGFGDFDGKVVTIRGANGFSVTGQAVFQFSDQPSQFLTPTTRDFMYAQTDYHFTSHFLALGGFKYENESGSSGDAGSSPETIQRGNYSYTLQFSGDVRNRLFYNLGTGLEDNGLFGFAGTPRASLAYYLVRPSGSGFFSGTKLHGSFGKGIKEPSIFQQTNSLYGALIGQSGGAQLISEFGVTPLGPENSRTFDGGVDQQLLNGRARVGVTYFHNQFTNGAQNVPQANLIQLGIPAAGLSQFQFGAYINALAFRSQGIEFESEYRISNHLVTRGGYTYNDAVVENTFATAAAGTSFTVPIGAFAPLKGARPFRVAPHTGYFGINYTRPRFFASLTGTLVSRRDDSDFLSDANFGNTLLLPNRNLLGSYQRLELGGGYQITPRINIYSNVQNLLSEHYFEAFGFPALPLTFRSGLKLNFGGESWKLK